MMKAVIMASVLALTCGGIAQAATCTASFVEETGNGNVNKNGNGNVNKNGNGNGNGNGATKTVSYLLEQGSGNVTAACYSNNDTNTIDAAFSFNGISGWELADKTDDAESYLDGGFSQFGQGTWSILNPLGYESILVTLKQGKTFAAFLLDSTAPLTGIWNTSGPGKGSGGLSHASVYFAGEPAPAPVPLPAGAALLPAGLAAFAFLRRRRKAA